MSKRDESSLFPIDPVRAHSRRHRQPKVWLFPSQFEECGNRGDRDLETVIA